MPLALNHNPPTIMHVDLNSCFATIEQQANPLLRGKPMVVAAYNSPNGCVVAPSIEAKRYGHQDRHDGARCQAPLSPNRCQDT
jgi:DNA polymerase-4